MAKVLVADDSLTVRKVVERTLEARRIQVVSAASGSEAIERIEREAPDLVICDVLMPDKDGYQVCEFVKNHPDLARTPVLLISGIVNGTVLERAAKVRSDDVMRKPFAAEELIRKVDSFLSAAGPGPPPCPSKAADDDGGRVTPPTVASLAELPVRSDDPTPDAASALPLDLKASLAQFVGVPGVILAALVDREGFLVESAAETRAEAELAWALASTAAEAGEGIGRELTQGVLQAMVLEYEGGVVLLQAVGPTAMLAVVLRDPTVVGKVRYSVKRALPELLRAM